MILFRNKNRRQLDDTRADFFNLLAKLELKSFVNIAVGQSSEDFACHLNADFARDIAPNYDTLYLSRVCHAVVSGEERHLDREILLAMLLGPVSFVFPHFAELQATLHMRRKIVETARNTELAFSTEGILRPQEYWKHDEDTGFTLKPGKSLLKALSVSLMPEDDSTRYGFSCYRATEYVMLLGVAEGLHAYNPAQYRELERLWQQRALMSGEFQETLLREYGSLQSPLPAGFYVPGDRVWFRNPDEHSANATGYEGSWVVYLGGGQFNNFWDRNSHYSMEDKCLEIYHWRNATCVDAAGELQIDEAKVNELVLQSRENPEELQAIMERMLRLREPQGVYVSGGCIDASREHPRWVCPDNCDIRLPEYAVSLIA